jgi:hypothetical protein
MGTYAAVVGSSFDDLTEDGIGLSLRVGVLGLQLAAVLDVVAHFVVGEAHVALCLIRGINERWHTRMSIALVDDGTHFMQNSSARPTSAGTDAGTMWRSPTARPLFPQVRGSPRSGGHWWLMLALTNEPGAAKDREGLVWSRIKPLKFGAGTARFCRAKPKRVNQLHFLHGSMSPVSRSRGSRVERVREHSGGAQQMLRWRCGAAKLHHKAAYLSDNASQLLISLRVGTTPGTKQSGPSEIDAYLLWISGHTGGALWDEGPSRSVQVRPTTLSLITRCCEITKIRHIRYMLMNDFVRCQIVEIVEIGLRNI